jgi:hypothetical protein
MRTLIQKNGRVVGVNNDALLSCPFQLTTNFPNNTVTLAANAGSNWLACSVSGGGPQYLSSLGGRQTGVFRCQMRVFDGQKSIALTSGSLHSGAFVGNGLNPYPFPVPLFIDDLRRLDVFLTDISGNTNTVRLALRSSQWKFVQPDTDGALRAQTEIPNRLAYPFFYCLDGGQLGVGQAGLGALANAQATITILPSHDFQLFQISGVSTGAFNIDVVDANTGESILNQPGDQHIQQDSGLFVGTNFFPFRFNKGRLFRRGQKLLVNLTDTSNATNNIDLVFGGKAIATQLPGVK